MLGYLPSDPTLKLSERHLGLIPTGEQPLPEGFLDRLAALVETHVDLDSVIAVSRRLSAVSPYPPTSEPHPPLITHHSSPITLFPAEPVPVGATIGVARDETFNFYYQDNLDLLEAHGAELVPFSPLHDAEIPAGVDALYLGGGFPEMQAERLAANRSMLQSVRRAAESGMPVYAECGGLMYLSQGIVNGDGGRYPMVGAVPGWCSMAERRLSMGYVNVRSVLPSPLGPAGIAARGHEFHWSRWDGLDPSAGPYRVANQGDRPEGYARGNLLATFVHLHFGANRNLAPNFVASARAYREKRMPHG